MEISPRDGRRPGARLVAVGRLDLHDLGAQVGEQHRGVRAGEHPGESATRSPAGRSGWSWPQYSSSSARQDIVGDRAAITTRRSPAGRSPDRAKSALMSPAAASRRQAVLATRRSTGVSAACVDVERRDHPAAVAQRRGDRADAGRSCSWSAPSPRPHLRAGRRRARPGRAASAVSPERARRARAPARRPAARRAAPSRATSAGPGTGCRSARTARRSSGRPRARRRRCPTRRAGRSSTTRTSPPRAAPCAGGRRPTAPATGRRRHRAQHPGVSANVPPSART